MAGAVPRRGRRRDHQPGAGARRQAARRRLLRHQRRARPGHLLGHARQRLRQQANSRTFLLRVYLIHNDWKTTDGGSGVAQIKDVVTLRDPDKKIPFKIVTEGSPERYLTGGDFDVESFRIARDGTLWFGEEFGPFLVHTDATGKVLDKPIPLPDVKSPSYPADYPAPFAGDPNLADSNGFEGMALSADGRYLYPTLEGPVKGDDPTIRRMYTFDLRRKAYTPTRRLYRVADPTYLVSDFSVLDRDHYVTLERDNFQGLGGSGAPAAHKTGYVLDLDEAAPDGTVAKRQVVDLLKLADPEGISSSPARDGDVGLGNPFAMPYQTIEAVLPKRRELVIVNDTNFGSTGRNPKLPDYSDFIDVRVPGLLAPARWLPRATTPRCERTHTAGARVHPVGVYRDQTGGCTMDSPPNAAAADGSRKGNHGLPLVIKINVGQVVERGPSRAPSSFKR